MQRRRVRQAAKLAGNVVFVVALITVAGFAALYAGLRLYGIQFYEVQSDSMVPFLTKGEVVASKSVAAHEVDVGDVIVFERDGFNAPMIHRVSRIYSAPDVHAVVKNKDGSVRSESWSYSPRTMHTKGDNNPVEDSIAIGDEALVGRYSFTVPPAFAQLSTATSRQLLFVFGAAAIAIYILLELFDAAAAMRRRPNRSADVPAVQN